MEINFSAAKLAELMVIIFAGAVIGAFAGISVRTWVVLTLGDLEEGTANAAWGAIAGAVTGFLFALSKLS